MAIGEASAYSNWRTALPFAEVWNGVDWTISSPVTAADSSYSTLSGISCGSSTSCVAVGFQINPIGLELPLAETWNGMAWSVQSPANPIGGYFSPLNAVSCVSATSCTGVGYLHWYGYTAPLAEAYS
jgi:hypothetical protein